MCAETFVAKLKDGQLPIARGDPSGSDVIFRAPDGPVVAAMLYGKVPMTALEAEAGLKVEGDRKLAQRYVDLFELPEKIG